jgi:hypothetical protein
METKEIFPGIIREWDKETGIVKVNGVIVESISYERHVDEITQFGHSPAEHTITIVYHAM